jgi:hypothetical protein
LAECTFIECHFFLSHLAAAYGLIPVSYASPFVLNRREDPLIFILVMPSFSKCHIGGIKDERGVKNMKFPYLRQLHVL